MSFFLGVDSVIAAVFVLIGISAACYGRLRGALTTATALLCVIACAVVPIVGPIVTVGFLWMHLCSMKALFSGIKQPAPHG